MSWCPEDSGTSEQIALLWRILRTILHEVFKFLGRFSAEAVGQLQKVLPGFLRLAHSRQDQVSRSRILTDQNLFPLESKLGRQAHSLAASIAKELRRLCCCGHDLFAPAGVYTMVYHIR